VPPANNQAERSLRPVVIMRKVIQAARPENGLENHSVLPACQLNCYESVWSLRHRDDTFQVGGEYLKVPDVHGENAFRGAPARSLQMQQVKDRAAAGPNRLAVPHRLLIVTQLKINDLSK
jgi:hypothetical protein